MKKLNYLFLLACVLLAGCVATPAKVASIDGADIAALKTSRIAVNYKLVDKRINYIETLYRVLWLETKTSRQDFSGVWRADADLTADAVERLRAQGFQADSIHQTLDGTAVTALNNALIDDTRNNAKISHPQIPGTAMIPVPLYFTALPSAPALDKARMQLREKGYRYLVDMTAMDLYGNAVGYGMVQVNAQPNLRVIDLASNQVVWNSNIAHFEIFQLGGDLKKLEENGMAKTREGIRSGIAKIDFQALWGLQ